MFCLVSARLALYMISFSKDVSLLDCLLNISRPNGEIDEIWESARPFVKFDASPTHDAHNLGNRRLTRNLEKSGICGHLQIRKLETML